MESTWTRPSEEQIREYEKAQLEHYHKMEDERVSKMSDEERKKYEIYKKDSEEKALELATRLEHCLYSFQSYIKSLKGEIIDQTGFGLERIFKDSLERALSVKIVDQYYWDQIQEELDDYYAMRKVGRLPRY